MILLKGFSPIWTWMQDTSIQRRWSSPFHLSSCRTGLYKPCEISRYKKKQLDHFSGCMMFVWCFKLVSWSVSWWNSFPTAINTKNSGRLASPNLQEWPWGLQQYQPFSSSRKASGCHWWCRLWKIQAFECAGGRCILVKQTWGGGFIFLCSSLFGETIQVD